MNNKGQAAFHGYGNKGIMLVTTLLLSLILLVMGITLLSIRASQVKRTSVSQYAVQARHIAEAGMEDARIKLQKCVDFPSGVESQKVFSYREEVNDFDGNPIGVYRVSINIQNREDKKYFQVESVGISGLIIENPKEEEKKELVKMGANGVVYIKPMAKRIISAIMITDDPLINSNAYKYINYWDSGSY